MSFKTILTYLADSDASKTMLKIAEPIVGQHIAHHIGLHLIPILPVHLPVYGTSQIPIPEEVLEQRRTALEKEAGEIKAAFEKTGGTANARCEWRCHTVPYGKFTESIVEHGKCADLIIVGQKSKDPYNTAADLSTRVIMETGRPTLVVPTDRDVDHIGQHVLIAWNGTRESARAAFDAVPFLKVAKSVRVLTLNPSPEAKQSNIAQGDELAIALARHGIMTEATTALSDGLSVGEELVERVESYESDLLVMGCYGHSRLREMFFGGATTEVLQKMSVPVLMAH